MAFHVQSILMHRASFEQIDVTVVRVRSPTFAVAQHGNSTVAPDFTIHSVHAMEFIDSHSLSEFVDYVSLLSCEVTKGDITSFSSLNSRDGFKNEISIAGDLKVLLSGSKAVGKFDTKELRSVHSDDEEHGEKKRKRKTWNLQKQETMVLYSCETEFMVSKKNVWKVQVQGDEKSYWRSRFVKK